MLSKSAFWFLSPWDEMLSSPVITEKDVVLISVRDKHS